MLLAGTCMGQALKVSEEERAEGATDAFAHLEATFDLSYDVARWLDSATRYFHVRFVRDKHEIVWTVGKCFDLRLFASVIERNDHLYDPNYDDIYEPLNEILKWTKSGGGEGRHRHRCDLHSGASIGRSHEEGHLRLLHRLPKPRDCLSQVALQGR